MTAGSMALMMLLCPSKFGMPEFRSDYDFLKRHIDAQRELKRMFPPEPLSRWVAKKERRQFGAVFGRSLAVLRTIDNFRPAREFVDALDL